MMHYVCTALGRLRRNNSVDILNRTLILVCNRSCGLSCLPVDAGCYIWQVMQHPWIQIGQKYKQQLDKVCVYVFGVLFSSGMVCCDES